MSAVYEEEYKGCSIKIYYDEDTENPGEWDQDSFLVFYHRDCCITRDDIVLKDELVDYFCKGEKIPQLKEYWIFPVTAYIHSGVKLYFGALNGTIRDPSGWDTSFSGALLVKKSDARLSKTAKKIAKGIIAEWNDYLMGNVYGFLATTQDGEDIDSCWGFYGDYEDGALIEARSSIDYYAERKRKKKQEKVKEYIKRSVPIIYRKPEAV